MRTVPPSPQYVEVTTGRTTQLTWVGWPWVVHADNGGNAPVVTLTERSTAPPDSFRFTLGTNDTHSYNPQSSERVELEGRRLIAQYDTYRWSTRLRVSGASPIAYEGTPGNIWKGWMLLMQIHQTPDSGEFNGSPPFGFILRSDDRLVITTRSTTVATTLSSTPLNAVDRINIPFVKDTWHTVELTLKFDKGEGAGYLKCVFDGTTYFDSVIPMGFNDVNGLYFKHGLYRNQSPGQTVIEFDTMSIVQIL